MSLSPRSRVAGGAIAVVALAVLAVGSFVVLRGGGSGKKAAAGSPGTATTDVASSNSPPPLLNTGENWDQIVRSIVNYQSWLFTHPRPELVDMFMLQSYEHYQDEKQGLINLATKGWRYEPTFRPVTVEAVQLQSRPSEDVAVVFLRSFGPPNHVVDTAGNVVLDSPGAGEASVLWTLRREPSNDPHWRLASIASLVASQPG